MYAPHHMPGDVVDNVPAGAVGTFSRGFQLPPF